MYSMQHMSYCTILMPLTKCAVYFPRMLLNFSSNREKKCSSNSDAISIFSLWQTKIVNKTSKYMANIMHFTKSIQRNQRRMELGKKVDKTSSHFIYDEHVCKHELIWSLCLCFPHVLRAREQAKAKQIVISFHNLFCFV